MKTPDMTDLKRRLLALIDQNDTICQALSDEMTVSQAGGGFVDITQHPSLEPIKEAFLYELQTNFMGRTIEVDVDDVLPLRGEVVLVSMTQRGMLPDGGPRASLKILMVDQLTQKPAQVEIPICSIDVVNLRFIGNETPNPLH